MSLAAFTIGKSVCEGHDNHIKIYCVLHRCYKLNCLITYLLFNIYNSFMESRDFDVHVCTLLCVITQSLHVETTALEKTWQTAP